MLRRGIALLVVAVALSPAAPIARADGVFPQDRVKGRGTEATLRSLATVLEVFAIDRYGRYPESTDPETLRRQLQLARLPGLSLLQDEWGTPLRIEVTKDRFHYRLSSAAADRRFEPLSAFDGTTPPREELDDPARDILLVDGELVHGLRPMQPADKDMASQRVRREDRRVQTLAEAASALSGASEACALLRPESLRRLLGSDSDPIRTDNRSIFCRWSWWPRSSAEKEAKLSLLAFGDRDPNPAETIRNTYKVVPPPPPPPPRPHGRKPGASPERVEAVPGPTAPADRWQDEEGIGDQARLVIGAAKRELTFRKGRLLFILSLETGQSVEEDRRLARGMAAEVLANLGEAPKRVPRPK